jgi:hypothetical protein
MTGWNPFQPPEDGLPPQDVRVSDLRAEPWPDGRRVKVHVEITPFLQRPNVEVTILDSQDREVSNINIIETIDALMSFTMHIRSDQVIGAYRLSARLSYAEIGDVDQKHVEFEITKQG